METRLVKAKGDLEQVLKDMLAEQEKKNYLAAEELKKKANQLKAEIETLEKKGNKKQQRRVIEDVQAMHEDEIKNWRAKWDAEIEDFNQKSDELEN